MMGEGQASSPALTPEANELVIDHRWVVRRVVNKLRQCGHQKETDDLTSAGLTALVAWAATHPGGPGFARGAWLRVEGAARDYLRGQRRHRRLIQESLERAGREFVGSLPENRDPDAESAEQNLGALEDEACGLTAARLLGAVTAFHRTTPEQIAIGRQEMQLAVSVLESGLAELPQRDRQILQLRYYEQLELQDVGSRLEPPAPYSSVTRFHRDALVRLGKILRKRGMKRLPHL